jgi:hypothetical protein
MLLEWSPWFALLFVALVALLDRARPPRPRSLQPISHVLPLAWQLAILRCSSLAEAPTLALQRRLKKADAPRS